MTRLPGSLILMIMSGMPVLAYAESRTSESPVILAGEIIVQQKSSRTQGSIRAAEARRQAIEERTGDESLRTIILDTDPEEEGILAPRHNAESSAHENRLRAKSFREGKDSTSSIMVMPPSSENLSAEESARLRAHDNRIKAKSYTQGKLPFAAKIGPDGIPMVSCTDGNIAGRIGDDMTSGSLFLIVKDKITYKVRCQ